MPNKSALLAVCFCAGIIGALANSTIAWLFGEWGVTMLAGVSISPTFTLDWLYPRLIWGGLWALPLFLTLSHSRHRRQWIRKGLWVSLLPTLAQLFYFFPYETPHGTAGLALGALTPVFVLLYNFVWGFVTGMFTRLLWGR
ncbi:MAG: hypothetical protein GWO11_04750 [Desulfuromonadales bacterium]|nr:hypothetical protein [Desulfuromonadales bacterium]NIR33721.1 hypothetical protein [Desulfuromonadales bacterium]NIS42395.1 hypothetical protein [Desulfuromonadales bacterium]